MLDSDGGVGNLVRLVWGTGASGAPGLDTQILDKDRKEWRQDGEVLWMLFHEAGSEPISFEAATEIATARGCTLDYPGVVPLVD